VTRGVAVVTGGSSGIGAACVTRLVADGFEVIAGARRVDRLRAVCDPVGARALPLDVADDASVAAFCSEAAAGGAVALLVNNAGGALGVDPVAEADLSGWQWMYDVNVLGTVRMTKALLPALAAADDGGTIVMLGSIAGLEPYEGGAGYNAAKHAVSAVRQVLRYELLGRPVRVCEIDPGMVDTDFSTVRFGGDEERAAKVYEGMTPLTADDIADVVSWIATRPSHVNIDRVVLHPRDQASARRVHRA
jgi:NADP-dependent 3-hydroxy acid dehydrogenase YdfG